MQKFDENNFEHQYFFGNEQGFNQAKCRKALHAMLDIGEINEKQHKAGMDSINKGEYPVVFHQISNEFGDEIIATLSFKDD